MSNGNPIMTAEGTNGVIELFKDKLTIKRKGFLTFFFHGLKGDKDIMISKLSSIQLKKADFVSNGYIQFAFMGGQEAKGGLVEARSDENTIMFSKNQMPAFEQMKDEIQKRMKSTGGSSSISSADELAKFADLKAKGIITEAEFQEKKKELLGL